MSELPIDGPAAPPRINGEIVFDAPWQSRAFGLAAVLAENERLDWEDFQSSLIEKVRQADTLGDDTIEPSVYWQCWLEALGALAAVDEDDWSDRCVDLAGRPAGHDH